MEKKIKYVINASNLHYGGGVQVAASVFNELLNKSNVENLSFLASKEVDTNISFDFSSKETNRDYLVKNTYGFNLLSSTTQIALNDKIAVFTIFGPLYRWKTTYKNIVGFAQPWIIYPDNECYKMLLLVKRVKTRLKFWIQGLFFKRADVLVVELEHVKQGLVRELGISPERIHVVHNCLSSLYLDKSAWQSVVVPKMEGFLRLGFVGRNYLHKNTSVFPAIVNILEQEYGIKVRCYVTFTEEEWAKCSANFRAVCISVGSLTVAQCPTFYNQMDAVIFPSLLECFSATPLEAMAMEKPLFASDRPFNRDVCGNHAHYFDPLNPKSAAKAITEVFNGGGPDPVALKAAREHAINFSNPKERAEKYLALLMGDEYVQSTSK